jgi:hypothetical protein
LMFQEEKKEEIKAEMVAALQKVEQMMGKN